MTKPETGRRLALAAFTLVMLACLTLAAELLARAFVEPSWRVRADRGHDALLVPDPVRGYALAPDLDRAWSRADWSIRVRTNAEGLRAADFETLRAAPRRALALGDSFTMGIGVEVEDAWPARVEARLAAAGGAPLRFVNAGVPGYSTRQMRQTLEAFGARLAPEVVVAAHYATSQWRVEAPYTLLGRQLVSSAGLDQLVLRADGSVVRTLWPPGPLRRLDLWLMQHFHVGARFLHLLGPVLGAQPGQWIDRHPTDRRALARDYAPTLAELGRMQALARALGARLYVLLVNRQRFDGSFSEMERVHNQIVAESARAMGIPVIDPLDRLVRAANGRPRFVFPTDIHWTPAAHDLAAQAVVEVLLGD